MKLFNIFILASLFLTSKSVLASPTIVGGNQAKALVALLDRVHVREGNITVVGYFTEKVTPPTEFRWASLESATAGTLSIAQPGEADFLLDEVAGILGAAGVAMAIEQGGTTYITYHALVNCSAVTTCVIN